MAPNHGVEALFAKAGPVQHVPDVVPCGPVIARLPTKDEGIRHCGEQNHHTEKGHRAPHSEHISCGRADAKLQWPKLARMLFTSGPPYMERAGATAVEFSASLDGINHRRA